MAEEAEARRLQQKQLQGMTEADFGFDEAEWLDAGKKGDEDGQEEEDGLGRAIIEYLPQIEITDQMPPDERLKILKTRYPEFEPLSKEFLELQAMHEDLRLAAEAAKTVQKHTAAQTNGATMTEAINANPPTAVLKHTALSAYLAALCMYFALFTSIAASPNGSTTAMSPSELRDHPIMDSLMQTRTLWTKVKDLAIPSPSDLPTSPPVQSNYEPNDHPLPSTNATSEPQSTAAPPKKPRKRKSRAQKAAEATQLSASALRAARLAETEASLASLSSLIQPPSNPRPKTSHPPPTQAAVNDDSSDFGDPTSIPAHEAAHKAAVKKSLKFYTSQIVSKAQKREMAGRDAGGDADLPYKERLRDRQERLNVLAEKQGKKNIAEGEELDGGEVEEGDLAAARDVRGEGDEYYDLISSRAAQKKAEKATRAAEAAGGVARVEEEEGKEGAKRKVSYAIEKNKGLTPKRKKEVRNPRVKKRKKYEEKKKKLGSVRQVWKGGEGKGYQGEKTGIKGGLIRSVKL